MYIIAFVMIFSFFIIRFIDSDWAFDHFKFSNHNLMVVMITCFLIFVNIIAIYESLKYSQFFTNASKSQKENYLKYENDLYQTADICIKEHNALMDKKEKRLKILKSEQDYTNSVCLRNVSTINDLPLPKEQNKETLYIANTMKGYMKSIVLNLSAYEYINVKNSNQRINEKVRINVASLINEIERNREIMQMNVVLEDNKKAFIKL
ncbi:MAG: hypothetical protein PHX18_06150 [Candidatus Gastranaerophilales bacterium]|nr:hypothetical protein [Candidatus Gastranaerophilales bacterium]